MRVATNWKDYELLDTSSGERLERWGDVILIRPDPQVIWNTEKSNPFWNNAHGRYIQGKSGRGRWQIFKDIPEKWEIKYKDLNFNIKPMKFKHTGIFPEQGVNWDFATEKIKKSNKKLNILNLFAYTGGATIACLKAGASVCHVDASKGMVQWAKENAISSNVIDKPVRWLVDDCIKFVEREIRRGNKYDGIIMDPPSYGKGPKGESWKIEDQLYHFLNLCSKVLSNDAEFLILNSYTTGLPPDLMEYILGVTLKGQHGGKVSSTAIGLNVTETGYSMPCGSTAIWQK